MISGDRQPVASRVAREIGCEEVVGECLPQNKVEFVRQMKSKGYRVAVVGDGVNDAPALAAGDLGIAMGAAGSEVAIHSATIALMNNDLRRLPFLVKLSRQTRAVINQNFMIGILRSSSADCCWQALKYISPIVAAVLHVHRFVNGRFQQCPSGPPRREELDPHIVVVENKPPTMPNAPAIAATPKLA